jgi:hypothetical protein
VEQLQGLNLATPVLDVHMPYVFDTRRRIELIPDALTTRN